jgi:RND family efflux transporter MFP subunit
MHPEVIRDEPGLCPICHMKLTPLVSQMPGETSGAIRIDPVIVQNVGIRTAPVRRGALTRAIRATGTLEEAESNVHDVNLRVGGWIERLQADTVGMHVEAGDPLFDLYSPELQVAVDELIASRRDGGGDGAGRAALVQATRRKLERYGLRAAEIDRLGSFPQAPRSVTFTSPVTGHVTEKRVVAGGAVQAGERVLRIVDHSTLWLDVQVHPADLPLVTLGARVTARIEGARGADVEGLVVFVHPHLDPSTRTATVRARIPNPDLTLRPGMYAIVRVDATVATDALVVPREAVIDTGARQLLFVAPGEGRFEPREVTVGETGDDGGVEVRRGVAEGERVVTSGQFLLDAESRTQEAIRKHLAERAPRAAANATP